MLWGTLLTPLRAQPVPQFWRFPKSRLPAQALPEIASEPSLPGLLSQVRRLAPPWEVARTGQGADRIPLGLLYADTHSRGWVHCGAGIWGCLLHCKFWQS